MEKSSLTNRCSGIARVVQLCAARCAPFIAHNWPTHAMPLTEALEELKEDMYEDHPSFIQPESEKVKVWRYMDFTKFVSLLESRKLYFTRADKFEDPFEGSLPKLNVEKRDIAPDGLPDDLKRVYPQVSRSMAEVTMNLPRYTAINCWHMNEHESASMWKLYLKSDEGIAIQSTYSSLKSCFIDEERIYLGIVKYIDYDREYFDPSNHYNPFVHKRKSFQHEKEVRALVRRSLVVDNDFDFSKETINHGLKIEIDIETLIQSIYVAPNAHEWFVELVEATVERYGYTFQVAHSKLDETPLF